MPKQEWMTVMVDIENSGASDVWIANYPSRLALSVIRDRAVPKWYWDMYMPGGLPGGLPGGFPAAECGSAGHHYDAVTRAAADAAEMMAGWNDGRIPEMDIISLEAGWMEREVHLVRALLGAGAGGTFRPVGECTIQVHATKRMILEEFQEQVDAGTLEVEVLMAGPGEHRIATRRHRLLTAFQGLPGGSPRQAMNSMRNMMTGTSLLLAALPAKKPGTDHDAIREAYDNEVHKRAMLGPLEKLAESASLDAPIKDADGRVAGSTGGLAFRIDPDLVRVDVEPGGDPTWYTEKYGLPDGAAAMIPAGWSKDDVTVATTYVPEEGEPVLLGSVTLYDRDNFAGHAMLEGLGVEKEYPCPGSFYTLLGPA